MRVAIQGIAGSFHEQAAHSLLGPDITVVSCHDFHEVFRLVKTGQVEFGVTAVENSLHGSINEVYRLLAHDHTWVCGETVLHIQQYLIGRPHAQIADIQRILSQTPALSQCENWLQEHVPDIPLEATADTAASVQSVMASTDKTLAAIAGKRAAQLYGGSILAGPINDDPNNYTRFFLLQKNRTTPSDANRTSIILKTDHTPGALWRALGVFGRHRVNLSKLDSHPMPGDRRHYRFYIDFDCGLETPTAHQIFSELREQNCTIITLGSYRATT